VHAIGGPIYVSRTAYNSLVRDSPTQALRDGYRAIIEDLDLDIAPDVNMADRVDLYRDNIQYRAAVAWPRQRRLELRLDHALNKAPHPIADARFNWVEPVVKKLGARLSFRM
jgi:hypothetical protein